MLAKLLFAAIALQALLVTADPDPIIPGPGDTYKQGGDCDIEWAADTTGKWTDMQIELKTGNNVAMVPLKVITTIDATKQTKYVYPCPEVSPNSAIYFYEFTSSSSTEKYWTTRFTITDADGNSTPPTETTQPNGDKIAWGTGMLAGGDGSSAPGPAPSGLSSLPSNSSSTMSGSSSVLSSLSSSSRLSSTRTPTPTQTGTTGDSQSNTGGDMAIAVPKALAFVVGLVAASSAFFL